MIVWTWVWCGLGRVVGSNRTPEWHSMRRACRTRCSCRFACRSCRTKRALSHVEWPASRRAKMHTQAKRKCLSAKKSPLSLLPLNSNTVMYHFLGWPIGCSLGHTLEREQLDGVRRPLSALSCTCAQRWCWTLRSASSSGELEQL